ncbi:hypothetical protein B484DRAFT_344871 [Ochromonadaceae sp. CCMP2298]|nr:hypothetical protein B484DRAFT_344871 [Ochromonadaceae sp. CCMP2298]
MRLHREAMTVALALMCCLQLLPGILGEVTVLKQVQVAYDRSPKVRIRGSGFDADDHDIQLNVGCTGLPPLVVDKDYLISKDPDGDGIILKLLGNRKWVDLTTRTPPVALVLSSVSFASSPDKNLLVEPVIIAQLLPTPTVKDMDVLLYQSASNELRINGTGFVGAKKVDLFFQPPLTKAVAYEDVTPYPLTKNQVVLRLRHGYSWRETPGPLFVIGVDTGGGPVKVDEDAGVKVAEVADNLDMHSVTVLDSAPTQLVYFDDPTITLTGTGFNTIGNALRWANGIAGNNVNYTTLSTTETAITLRITAGSRWRSNVANLPGALTLLAVNAGAGYVAVGPMNAGKGRDVAMVFERPQIFSSIVKLSRTHSHEMHLKGTGFPELTSGFRPQLKFYPALTEGVDYNLRVQSRTNLEITLVDGGAWRNEPGALQVTHINTRGDAGGWITLPGSGVHVADVTSDVIEGGVEVIPTGVKVYASALSQPITITGTGFTEGMKFTFEPALNDGDYTLEVQSKNIVVLRLAPGKKWRKNAGLLTAKTIKLVSKSKSFKVGGEDGIRVAVVLTDPSLYASTVNYHETQSKLIVIEGQGFTNVADLKIIIRPSSPGAYKVIGVVDDAIRVQLLPGLDWLPSFMSLKDEDKSVLLQVSGLDTGAGQITFADPITVGTIVKDREGVTCDDSCEFAFDGVCDDGSEPFDEYYYENYFNYMDDDMGGNYDYGYGYGEEDAYGEFYDDFYGDLEDDYYMENDNYQVSACVQGTDCTDCGGVDAVIDYSLPLGPNSDMEECTNTCMYSRDGICDDPRGTQYCEIGTDCQDCGRVGFGNSTTFDDDGWWDDDDDYWNFNDGNFLDQTEGLEANRHKVKVYRPMEEEGAASMFLYTLEAMVYAVGAIFLAASLYLLSRWYHGESVPFLNAFNRELNEREFEMRTPQRMPVTPDSFRT